jgi:F-type H+-transporting ATPase subunit delta
MEAAEERGVLDGVQEDAQALHRLIRESEDLQGFLADPLIHPEQKQAAFRALFSGKVTDLTLSFLLLLGEKRRERLLESILEGFLDLLDERRGIATAQVRSASVLTSEQEERLAQRLSAFSGKQVRLEVEVDDGLRAGFVARMGDQVFDGTVEAQLNRLRRRLAAGL